MVLVLVLVLYLICGDVPPPLIFSCVALLNCLISFLVNVDKLLKTGFSL